MRNLVYLEDFTNEEIENIFDLADEMKGNKFPQLCQAKLMATLFYEPSTRTRLSFESAMLRLGGNVLGFADAKTSSVSKGETIADTARMVSNYADLLVVRNPYAGAAKVMAMYSNIPVINGGDDSHRHPTQTLTDLYTITRRKGQIAGLKVGICGDLKFGRTAHSLAYGLARFGAKLVHIAPEPLRMPDYVNHRLKHVYGVEPYETDSIDEVIAELDIIYVTRVQKERLPKNFDYKSVTNNYTINLDIMKNAKEDTLIMHPLPRVNELAYELDNDPRAIYFEESANGVPVRMALIVGLLGLKDGLLNSDSLSPKTISDELVCSNPKCVISKEKYLLNKAEMIAGVTCCDYCGQFKSALSVNC